MPLLRIARHELRALFFTPIAWILLIVFLLHSSWFFVQRLQHNVFQYFVSGHVGRPITASIFTNENAGVFTELLPYLSLYVPLLTMGAFSREVESGGIKLLLSSPVRLSDVVLAKYLAVVSYLCSFIAFLLLLAFGAGVFVTDFEYASVFSAALGFWAAEALTLAGAPPPAL